MRPWMLCALAPLWAACPEETTLPGDETLGRLAFRGTVLEETCAAAGLTEFVQTPEFVGTLRRDSRSTGAWLTLEDGTSLDAEVGGGTFAAHNQVPRTFAGCRPTAEGLPCTTSVSEELAVRVFTRSGFTGELGPCERPDPTAPPTAADPAVAACGTLTDTVLVPAECGACADRLAAANGAPSCVVRYQIEAREVGTP